MTVQNHETDGSAVHKRRAHYAGKYPKKYEEKYKELNADKYEGITEHVKAKGNTPAGTHVPIMVEEVLETLRIQPGENGLDCTFGYGGHSEKMLEKLSGQGHLTSLDIDPIESVKSEKRLRDAGYGAELHSVEHLNFADIDQAAQKYGKFDFILADLGVSSMQIDNPERGFSYKTDGPLDLRMDPTKGKTAAELLKKIGEEELAGLFAENGDEPYADLIAHTLITYRKSGRTPETTTDLRGIIERALTQAHIPDRERKDAVKKSCARCFQALRIELNHEYESLDALLRKLPEVLAPGGRVVILTFHSGEDRLVKQAFKYYYKEGLYAEIAQDVVRPSAQECTDNPRARSTKLRFAVRAEE